MHARLILPLLMLIIAWLPLTASADSSTNQPIKLATTTSTENSGLLKILLPAFTKETGYQVHTIAVGTGKALRMGRDGDVDVVLVHAPGAEKAFVEAGYGVNRKGVMYNDFVMLGPKPDSADVKSATDLIEALQKVVGKGALFVSRGDDSGTHKKELHLWKAANQTPKGAWYREAGQGMGKVIQIAGELDAYTLADRGTWLAYKDKSPLQIVFSGDPRLFNPYGIIAVNPERYPDINYKGARALIDWIIASNGQQLIGDFNIAGTKLFNPSAKEQRVADTPK